MTATATPVSTRHAVAYATGLGIGALAATLPAAAAELRAARDQHYAAPYGLDQALTRWQLLGRPDTHPATASYLRACGLLAGHKRATAYRADAHECVLCENRILGRVDEHARCSEHGHLCPSCQPSICTGRCDRLDLITWENQ